MSAVKFLLIAFLIWFIIAALSPLFNHYFLFPYVEAPLNDSLGFQRSLTVRSACFLTLSYFIVNYLRHRKPLSSVVPILTFSFFYTIFRVGFLIKKGGPNMEWLVIAFSSGLTTMLYLEYKAEINKIFTKSW